MRAFILALFLMLGSLSASSALSSEAGGALYTRSDDVALRSAPEPSALVMARLPKGQRLEVVSSTDGWTHVSGWVRIAENSLSYRKGWVKTEQLTEDRPATANPFANKQAASQPVPETRTASKVKKGRSDDERFVLSIGGTKGAAYRGDCRLYDDSARYRRYRIQGVTPKRYWFDSAGVACSIENRGGHAARLRVRLEKAGRLVSVVESQGTFGWIIIRSGGPWGAAQGRRSASRPAFIRLDPPTGPVPPLKGRTVPPLGGG